MRLKHWETFFLLIIISVFILTGCRNNRTDITDQRIEQNSDVADAKAESENENAETGKGNTDEEKSIAFPYELDDGKLIIDTLFQYSGLNPDCSDEEDENIGAIQLINDSEQYVESSEIMVLLGDGTMLDFIVEDIPSGSTVMAFDVNNTAFEEQQEVLEISADVSYAEGNVLYEDKMTVSVEENGIYLSNQSENSIQNITVRYHCDMDEVYFGGKSYKKQVNLLGVGESTMLSAEECYFGKATVVRIQY